MPPSGGLLFLEKGQKRSDAAARRPRCPFIPHPQRMMASSHLLEDGVSDNLGVPSVSLLSEDAVASESVIGKGWSVKGGV